MIRGVVFDLDGVLVSTDEMHFRAWERLAMELGITNFTKEDNKFQKGVSRMESLEVVLRKGNRLYYNQKEKLAFATRKNNYYTDSLKGLTSKDVLKDVIVTLEMLRSKNIAIGIGSASKNARMILEKIELNHYIDQVSCGLDTSKSKPDPEVFIIAAKKLGLQNEECLVVEDSAAGIIAAKAANMKSLGVGPEYRQLGADYASLTLQSDVDWNEILKG